MTSDADLLLARCQDLVQEGHVTQALHGFRAVLQERPDDMAAAGGAANCLLALGLPQQAYDLFRRMALTGAAGMRLRAASAALLSQQYVPDQEWPSMAASAGELAPLFSAAQVDGVPAGRPLAAPLRIGFVSPDLSDHPVGMLLLPLLLFLNRGRFLPILFSTGGRDDATRASLRRFCEWHDLHTTDHEQQWQYLRAQRLDVLIDLAGHTAGNSLPVFARRAAPLQASWLGYFATTGLPAMDAVILDPVHAPAGAEAQFCEEVLRLPNIRWCYHPVGFAPPVAPAPVHARGFVTFGSFNNTTKYNPAVLSTWARILAAVPSSRLVLKWKTFADPLYCETVLSTFEREGVSRERIELRNRSPHAQVLQEYADIDIALDPFPFTGGMTSCESLWMGVPLVTMSGGRTVSRQGHALISVLGRQDWTDQWIAKDVDSYVQRAVALASSPRQLSGARAALRDAMKGSALMDGRRFARDFEELLLDWVTRKWRTP